MGIILLNNILKTCYNVLKIGIITQGVAMDSNKNNEKEKISCPVIKKCGGCQLQQYSYEKQLQEKQKHVSTLLSKYCHVENIIGMDNPYYYRNKVHAVFDLDKKGNVISGVYESGTHNQA